MSIQRMAVVNAENKVVNVIIYDTDATWTPPEGCKLIQDGRFSRGKASPGGTWDGRRFVAAPDAPSAEPSIESRLKLVEARLGLQQLFLGVA